MYVLKFDKKMRLNKEILEKYSFNEAYISSPILTSLFLSTVFICFRNLWARSGLVFLSSAPGFLHFSELMEVAPLISS